MFAKIKKSLFDFIYFKVLKKKRDIRGVRRVYLGLKFRLTAFIGLALTVIMILTGAIFYLIQVRTLTNEKTNQGIALTKSLAAFTEYYLNKTNPYNSRKEKYLDIKENCLNFKEYNEGIFKIFLTDEKGRIMYSTYSKDIGVKTNGSYILRCLAERKVAKPYNFNSGDLKLRALAIPVFLSKGNLIQILDDFDTYYDKYNTSSLSKKKQMYRVLWKKYKGELSDDFDPITVENKGNISRANDLDFLFVNLFGAIIKLKKGAIRKGEYYLWNDRWLFNEKQKIITSYQNNMPENAIKSLGEIREKLHYMREQIENLKLIGAMSIIYDRSLLNVELLENISTFFIVAIVISLLSLIIFYFLISKLVYNLKLLEDGAHEFAALSLDSKIIIKSHEETGRLADIMNKMAKEIREKLKLEKFVSKSTMSMVKERESENESVKLGKVRHVDLSFIFADVRGFTAFSEKNKPAVVIDTLNLYFTRQFDVVKKYNGDVDDYVGDQIMAHFEGKNHKLYSLRAAVEIKKSIDILNEQRRKSGLPIFEVGIGVHSGQVVTGNIGHQSRMDFACVGDAVNTTSRLCGKADPGEILVSKKHLYGLTSGFKVSKHDPIEAKGKKEKIEVYTVVDYKGKG